MGNFTTRGTNKLTSEDRFAANPQSVALLAMPLTRTASTGGPAMWERHINEEKRATPAP